MNTRGLFAVAALAGATLCLESTLTRLLAVAQYYHFAFLVISLALLGFAASGTLLGLSRKLRAVDPECILSISGISFVISMLIAYLAVNVLPFDSYAIAIDRRQLLYFALYYLALSLPFVCSGLGIAAALSSAAQNAAGTRSNIVYAANLFGSAGGALLAPGLMALAGVPGALCGCAVLGALPALLVRTRTLHTIRLGRWFAAVTIGSGTIVLVWLGAANLTWRAPLGLTISPYKSLAYARLHPGYRSLLGRWNAFSRLDMVEGAGTRALPGLSYTYPGDPPLQLGLSIDGDHLSPVSLVTAEQFEATSFLPEAVAFGLHPNATALVIEPGAGLGVLQAQSGGAREITAVLPNWLVPRAIARTAPDTNPFDRQGTRTAILTGRSFLQRDTSTYDLVYLPLSDSYHPVTSGAYSLQETYSLTIEMFIQALSHLTPDGILVVTRWMQTPPSESIRMAATLVEALEERGISQPGDSLVAYRGIQTITFLVKPAGWDSKELSGVRQFAENRRYDLVWAPDITLEETNRFNRLPEPDDYLSLQSLLESPDRSSFYADFPFDIRPATDDHPFFYHFFTWEQIPEILSELGRTWQPFGGSGFLILLALLGLVTLFSAVLILAPLALQPLVARGRSTRPDGFADSMPLGASKNQTWYVLAYFSLIGLAFLMVEIPLIQRWILLLGQPTYAFSAVVLSLLLFSGLGSMIARKRWLPKRAAMGVLVLMAVLTPWMTAFIIQHTLGWPAAARAGVAVIALFPLGMLMGLPFPLGLLQMETGASERVPWAWAVNGCASVIAAVLAAILSLTSGFSLVLWVGAGAYACSLAVYTHWRRHSDEHKIMVPHG